MTEQLRDGLLQMRSAYDAALSVNPLPFDHYVIAKDTLDAQWQSEMEPVIRDMYWHPIRGGVDDAPEDDAELRKWLRERYQDAAFVGLLIFLLQKYHIRAANLGGQYALDQLGINQTFRLTNTEYLQMIIDRSLDLTGIETELSLIDTTIDELAREIPKARAGDIDTMLALGTFILLRSPIRTVVIERYERPWAVGNTENWTYQRNGVSYKMYDVQGVGCVQVCAGWHGQVFTVDEHSALIPQHSGCDCGWAAVLYDGQIVGTPPVTASIPGEPWALDNAPWVGG